MCIRKAFKASDEWFSGEEWKNQELINKSLLTVTLKIHVQSIPRDDTISFSRAAYS